MKEGTVLDVAADLQRRGFPGEVGLLITDLAGRELYAQSAEQVFPSASTIKVPLLLMALEWTQQGRLPLAERVVMRPGDRVPGSGVLHDLQGGLALTWLDVLTLMIIVSDNTATNLLIKKLGVETFNLWLDGHGWTSTRLVGKLQLPPEQQNGAQRRGERNRTTAREQVDMLRQLACGQLLDTQHTELALDILSRQQYRDLIGRGVPRRDESQLRYRLCSKSGELRGVHHDVGVLYTPRPLVIALLSQGGLDLREHPENHEVRLLSQALWPLLASLGQVYGDI